MHTRNFTQIALAERLASPLLGPRLEFAEPQLGLHLALPQAWVPVLRLAAGRPPRTRQAETREPHFLAQRGPLSPRGCVAVAFLRW